MIRITGSPAWPPGPPGVPNEPPPERAGETPLQQKMSACGMPMPEPMEDVGDLDPEAAIGWIEKSRSFSEQYRASWGDEACELPDFDGPYAAALLIGEGKAGDDAAAWEVLEGLHELVRTRLLDPWCLQPCVSSPRVRAMLLAKGDEGARWLRSVCEAALDFFGRKEWVDNGAFTEWYRRPDSPDSLLKLSLRAVLDHCERDGPDGALPWHAPLVKLGIDPKDLRIEFDRDRALDHIYWALASLHGHHPTERHLPEVLRALVACSDYWDGNVASTLFENGIVHPDERTRGGRTLLGELLSSPELGEDAWLTAFDLLKHGADPSLVDIRSLCPDAKRVLLQALIDFLGHCLWALGADKDNLYHLWSEGTRQLHTAMEARNFGAARALVQLGCDAAEADRHGRAPIHKAEDARTMAILIQHGADVRARDDQGRTALHYAVQRKDVEAVCVLCKELAATPDALSVPDLDHRTPLKIVLEHIVDDPEYRPILHVLVHAGAQGDDADRKRLEAVPSDVRKADPALDGLLKHLGIRSKA